MMRHLTLAATVLFALPLAAQPLKVVAYNPPDSHFSTWQAASDNVRVVKATPTTALREIADADGWLGGGLTPERLAAAKKLRWVQSTSAGVERYLHLAGENSLANHDIILTNNQIVQGPEIADHAMALLLALTRDIPQYLRNQDKQEWVGRQHTLIELRGKKAVLIGCGGIGMQIAQRAWAHGMTVVGVDPEDIPFSPFLADVVKPDRLDEVLDGAFTVFVAAPHTEKSHKMMGSKQFELMDDEGYFIAVSRGGVYDLNALVKALDSKQLGGAGVDVTDPEPLPKGHALWQFENAIVTPHIAGRSDMDRSRMYGTVTENIRRFGAGMPLVNVVDTAKGY